MISAKKKIYFCSTIFVILFFSLVLFIILPFSREVKRSSGEFALQKKTLVLLQGQLQDLADFKKGYPDYQAVLSQIQDAFVSRDAPIGFIEFIEKEAQSSNLIIKITPLNLITAKADPWVSVGFLVSLDGSSPDCLRFLERLERSPWLVEISQINIKRLSEKSSLSREFENLEPGDVSFILSIKVFSNEDNI